MATLKVCSQVFVCVFLFERLKAKKKQFHGIVRRCGCVCDSVPAYMHLLHLCLLEKALLEVRVSLKEHWLYMICIHFLSGSINLFKNMNFNILNSYLIINYIYK